MTNEEYLRASGWTLQYTGAWYRLSPPLPRPNHYPLAEAIEMQLAEDRARYNFVRERSWMWGGLLMTQEERVRIGY